MTTNEEFPMVKVVSVKPLGGFKLRVRFSDGSVGVHDFSATVARDGEMVQPLKDSAFFARVFIELGALTWHQTVSTRVQTGCTKKWRKPAN